MSTASPWCKILEVPTTSHAIHIALNLTPTLLTTTQLPIPVPQLSPHARNNFHAVQRALSLPAPLPPPDPWHDWHCPPSAPPTKRTAPSPLSQNNSPPPSPTPNPETTHPSPSLSPQSLPPVTTTPTPRQAAAVPSHHIQALTTWARTSPHTEPPSDALHAVACTPHPHSVLALLVPDPSTGECLAPFLRVLTPCVGMNFANHVITTTVVPYATALKTPAPRDLMHAIVAFCERHWRPALSLFRCFAHSDPKINGATGEMLVRVAAVLNDDGAFDALSALCKASWGEDGIRVVESLLARCKGHGGLPDVLIPALQANILGSENSVRFGKLLFTVARDVPAIAATHSQAMETVCLRSKVFLAKRAVAVLKSTNNDT